MTKERLQKILARAGYGSRRASERIIEAGRVTVDGKLAQLGDQADPQTQKIRVDGVPIPQPQPPVYIMLHKPRGYITTTRDPEGRRTVLDLITLPETRRGEPVRLYPVGRLDANSEGLVLLTNDGELTQRLTHPRYGHTRVYRVRVTGQPNDETLERWKRGVTIEGRLTRFDDVVIESADREGAWLRVTVHEGRKHLVRRAVGALGHLPERLIRVAMGPLRLGDLSRGKWRYLTNEEVRALQREVGSTRRLERRQRNPRRSSSPSRSSRKRSSSRSSRSKPRRGRK